jgi:peptide/nickel transport system substrate-binding protein
MTLKKQALAAAITAAAMLALTACGGGSSASGGGGAAGTGPTGEPVAGGTGRILQANEPRGLDPAVIANSWANSPVVGNALYGQLMIDDPTTGKVEYRIAKDFTTKDGGKTFTLTLRDDVDFSDGTQLTANDVKATWEHAKDPATSSVDFPQATTIDKLTVVDDTTLKVELVTQIPKFANSILQTGLNWIASAASIKGGSEVMDTKPVGAGPYTLEKWARQDVITLVRNKFYYDAPKPYLDKLEVRAAVDPEQRFNTLSSNGADVSLESSWLNLDKAKTGGLQVKTLEFGGGSVLTLNNTKAPFDDVRARKAFAAALDLNQIDDAVNQGTGKIPTTLFGKTSPFYQDTPLITKDAGEAQKLFDELAADGKPLSFTLSVFPGSGAALGNSIQTQLSAFKNVKVAIKTIDIATYGKTMATKDYDVITNSITFGAEPEPRLWAGLHGTSGGNFSGVNDPELNAALDKGRTSLDEADRKAAYDEVEKRLVEIVPVIFFSGSALGVMANTNVGGLQQYGLGSVLPETLWIQK